jgi:DNA repair exonuclease SbcCD ATPase subunit
MEREAKEALILRLFRAYPGGENKVSRATVDTYLKAVDFFPLRYIDMAVEQFANAQVQRDPRSRSFAPSTDELCTHIRSIRHEEGRATRWKKSAILQIQQRDHDAEVEAARTPEAMARVKRLMEECVEKITPTKRTAEEIAQAKVNLGKLDIHFQSQFSEPIEGVRISTTLLRKLSTFNSADTDGMDIGEDR